MSTETMPKSYLRFVRSDRLLHVLLLISFTILGFTGLAQKYSDARISIWFIQLMGGHRADQTYPSHVCRHADPDLDCARRADRLSGVCRTSRNGHVADAEGYHRLLRCDEVQLADDRRSSTLSPLQLHREDGILGGGLGHDPDDLDRLRSVEPNTGYHVSAGRGGAGGQDRPWHGSRSWRCWRSSPGTSTSCIWPSSTRASSPATSRKRKWKRSTARSWNSD